MPTKATVVPENALAQGSCRAAYPLKVLEWAQATPDGVVIPAAFLFIRLAALSALAGWEDWYDTAFPQPSAPSYQSRSSGRPHLTSNNAATPF